MLQEDGRADLPGHNGAVLAEGDPVHLQDVAVLGRDDVTLGGIPVLGYDEVLQAS